MEPLSLLVEILIYAFLLISGTIIGFRFAKTEKKEPEPSGNLLLTIDGNEVSAFLEITEIESLLYSDIAVFTVETQNPQTPL